MDNDFFEVRYDYVANEGSVDRVFLVMAGYLSALEDLSKVVSDSIDPDLEISYSLKGIEQGSIKSLVQSVSKKIMKSLSISNLTEITVQSMADLDEIDSKEDVEELAIRIETDLKNMDYLNGTNFNESLFNKEIKIDRVKLANSLKKLSEVSRDLSKNETVEIKNKGNVIPLNTKFKFDKDPNSLFFKKISSFKGKEVLLVKKPVFIGDSKWDFRSLDRKKSFSATIEHSDWLKDFQEKGMHQLSPGDSIIATVSYDVDENSGDKSISYSNYRVIEVHEVIKKTLAQEYLDFNDE